MADVYSNIDDKNVFVKKIKDKQYFNALGSYKGEVLLLGISYDDKTLKHDSMVERIKL